ncbi:hypothetical protein [Ralstonia solanacearum]|nr:hypothetical protein [Ralstonia solanacearum]
MTNRVEICELLSLPILEQFYRKGVDPVRLIDFPCVLETQQQQVID